MRCLSQFLLYTIHLCSFNAIRVISRRKIFVSIVLSKKLLCIRYLDDSLREQGKTAAETLDIIAQRSRDDSRTPMQWDASENAGFTTGTPWIGIADNYKAINAAAQMDAPDSIRSFYKTLVALRKKMPVISAGKIEFLYPDNADLLAYRRYDGETELLVLCNLREREIAKPLPVGWTDAEKLLGNYPDTADTLRPYECVVLKK